MSSGSVEAVEESGGCQMSIAARIVAADVGRFATWKDEYIWHQ
jgi:hypothetical protein